MSGLTHWSFYLFFYLLHTFFSAALISCFFGCLHPIDLDSYGPSMCVQGMIWAAAGFEPGTTRFKVNHATNYWFLCTISSLYSTSTGIVGVPVLPVLTYNFK